MTKILKHNVPFFSQKADIKEADWKPRGCGITALKMALGYWHENDSTNRSPDLVDLIRTGSEVGAYIEDVGWSHSGLVEIAKQYGYEGKNYDLVPEKTEPKMAFAKMSAELEKHPVLASVYKKFEPGLSGGHIVTVTGLDNDSIYMNDPEEIDAKLGTKKMELKKFLKGWKKRYIVIYPNNN